MGEVRTNPQLMAATAPCRFASSSSTFKSLLHQTTSINRIKHFPFMRTHTRAHPPLGGVFLIKPHLQRLQFRQLYLNKQKQNMRHLKQHNTLMKCKLAMAFFQETLFTTRVAEVGSLSWGAKMVMKIFVKCIFTMFATNALFLVRNRRFANLTQ